MCFTGAKYIPNDVVKKLNIRCAALLMGCASCSLTLQGCYAPIGAPLSYLMAGSPIIVGNLWNMIDIELCLFAMKFFKDTLEEPDKLRREKRFGTHVEKL